MSWMHSRPLTVVLICTAIELFCAGVASGDSAARRVSSQGTQRPTTGGGRASDDGVEVLPDRILQYVTRAGELARLGQYDEAIAEFRAAIKVAGRPIFTAYLNMGSVFFTKGDYAQAAEAFRQALAVRENSFQGHYNLAEALYAAGDYVGAEKEYRRVLELPSGRYAIRAHHFLGLALYKQRRLDEAIIEYRAAIEQAAGKYSEAHYNFGIALLELARPDAAEKEFRLAIEQEKNAWPEAQYNLAQALEKQNRFREAADAYEVYLRLAPGAADVKTTREYIDYLRRKP